MQKKLSIEGMSCNHCVMHVKNALRDVEGVRQVEVSLKDKSAVIELIQDVSDIDLRNAVSDAGYEVISID